jgi:hypothetical protein
MVVNLDDEAQNDEDRVTVGLTATADDRLIDDITGRELYRDGSPFTEYWHFKRQDNIWLLDDISQSTESKVSKREDIAEFARKNGYFYSPDWGWLLIPARGQLFDKAKFGVSDINNHVIGMYRQDFLLQLYTYDPNPKNQGAYLIAQTNLPKSYGDIVVRRRRFWHFKKPSGLNKISMEWIDFNKKYEVFASDAEQVTSFELLHPAFMEKLEKLPFEVNIEVVDNVVYLFAAQTFDEAKSDRYGQMLEILQEAYKQMKL